MSHFNSVDPKQNFPELEENIIRFWEENDIFRKSITERKVEDSYVFFDGPPFATGLPHYGHILAGTLKDVVPRFFTMQGKRIERRFGWDCHGVPVEFQVEKEQGIGGKPEIEKMGVEKYNELCRSIVLRCAEQWEDTVTRMGRWVDFKNDYKTMQPDYMESVWWVFKSLWDKGLIYEGEKVVAYSPKLGSPLSNFEAGLNYKDIDDPAVTVKFELLEEDGHHLQGGVHLKTYVLAWTTTPWTLPSNVALGFGRDTEYVKCRGKKSFAPGEELYILAADALSRFEKEFGAEPEILETFKGKEMLGKKYKPLFPFFDDRKAKRFEIIHDDGDYVSTEEGTGIVHFAPAFGAEDAQLCAKWDIYGVNPIDENGYFDDTIPELSGKYFRKDEEVDGSADNNVNDWVITALKESGKLFKREQIRHSYPHCWRTDCALMYRSVKTWFVHVEKIKDRMVELNKEIHWVPDAVGHKRFANWLENARDWAISRNRYWGAPLPVWRCTECDHVECLGSVAELQEQSVKPKKVFVLRHGEAEHNVQGLVNSDRNTPFSLTEAGKKQVAESAQELKNEQIDMIFCSPFPRTQETAEIVAKELGHDSTKIITDERLREVETGDMEGKDIAEFRKLYNSAKERFETAPHGGESGRDVYDRVSEFLHELQKKHHEKNILIVTHGDPARKIRRFFTNETPDALYSSDAETRKLLHPGHFETFTFSGRPQRADGELDLHRPYIDAVKLECEKCQQPMQRIPEVLDCWFESGSMPYAQSHYPFENKEHFENNFPADFIAEGLDQTRGWFYTLHVLATALFDTPAFKNIIVNGIVLAEDGQKMSKSKKNYPDPHEVFDKFGVDAVRFTLMNSPVVRADDLRFSEKTVLEHVKSVFLPLWNAYSFFVTYANIDEWKPVGVQNLEPLQNKLDLWMMSELHQLVATFTEKMEAYELFEAARLIPPFLDKLTNGYIRRSRRRFWKSGMEQDKAAAFQTLYTVITTLCQVLAPLCPFMSEEIYKNLTKEESVHLTDFPKAVDFPDDPQLREEFAVVDTIISLGLSLRAEKQIKVRQPLQAVEVFLPQHLNADILEENKETLLGELNVKEIIVMDAADKIAQKIVKPDARQLGPKFSKNMQQIIQQAKAGDFQEKDGGVQVGEYFLEEGTYSIEFLAKEGFDVASDNGIVVALNMEITEELKNEGLVRELIRMVQEARKEAGFDVSDRIHLVLAGDEDLMSVFQEYQEEIAAEVLAEEVVFGEGDGKADLVQEVEVEEKKCKMWLTKK